MSANSQHLLRQLDVAKRVVERAAEFDVPRAELELAGYVETFLQHAVGRTLVRHWAIDFRRSIADMVEARRRLVGRLLQARDIVLSAYVAHVGTPPDTDQLRSNLASLQFLDEDQWPISIRGESIVSLLNDPLNRYAGYLEWALVHAQQHKIQVDLDAMCQIFRRALDAGDAGDVRAFVDQVQADRLRAVEELSRHPSSPALLHANNELVALQLDDIDDCILYVVQHRPRLLAASVQAAIELYMPQLNLFFCLGGYKALVLLAPGPRYPWWSLCCLVAMASHSGVDPESISNGDLILARVGQAILSDISADPTTRQVPKSNSLFDNNIATRAGRLLLELNKVHLSALSDIERGVVIEADLLRYRQRTQWYDSSRGVAPLERQMSVSPGLHAGGGRGLGSPKPAWRPGRGRDATAPKELHPSSSVVAAVARVKGRALIEREKAAVQHLATWLFDQGHRPLSRTLGRGKTDLEDQRHGEAFVIEAKILTEETLPKSQSAMDNRCREWVNQVLEYADSQGLDRAYIVVFNMSKNSQVTAAESAIVADRVAVKFYPISATHASPSKMKGRSLLLRWQSPDVATR